MVSTFVISQILVGIAAIFDIASFQTKSRRTILTCLAISSAFTASHFFVLRSATAGICSLITFSRFVVAYVSNDRRWALFFVFIAIITLLLTYQSSLNLFPFAASILGAIGSFYGGDKLLRKCVMAATSLWIIHNALLSSPLALALEVSFLFSNVVGYWRFYRRKTYG